MYTVQKVKTYNGRLYAKIEYVWYIIGFGVQNTEWDGGNYIVYTQLQETPAQIKYTISFEESKGISILTSFLGMVLGESPLDLESIIDTHNNILHQKAEIANEIQTFYDRDAMKLREEN